MAMSPRAKAKPGSVRRAPRKPAAEMPEQAPKPSPDTLSLAEFRAKVTSLDHITTVTSYGKPIGQWVPRGATLRFPEPEPFVFPDQSMAMGKDQTGEQLRAMHRRQASVLAQAFPQRPSKT